MTAQMFLDLVGPQAAKRFRRGILPFVDLFAGGGGTSCGVMQAMSELGLNAQLAAVNHWETAVASHELNFPESLHFQTGCDRVDVEDLLSEIDSDGLFGLWASPSCVNFSQARNGVPLNCQDRSGCWAVVKWLRKRRAIHFWVENVKEFLDYGPVMQKKDARGCPLFIYKTPKGQWKECYYPAKKDLKQCYSLDFHAGAVRDQGISSRRWWKETEAKYGIKPAMIPDPKRKGQYFRDWYGKIRKLGYDLEYRLLDAGAYGAPTKRIRLIIQGVRRNTGRSVVWPAATHCAPDANGSVPSGMLPFRTARSIIDWSDLGTSIFDRPRSLSEKTIARIAVGLLKYGLNSSVVKFKGTGTANSVDAPLGTVQANGRHYALLNPTASVIIPQQRGGPKELRVKSVDTPMPTITASGADAVASCFAIQPEQIKPADFLVPQFGERPTQVPRTHSVDLPTPTVTSHGAGALVHGKFEPFIAVTNHGNGREGDKANLRRVKSVDARTDTITGSRSLALVNATEKSAAVAAGEKPHVITCWQDLAAAINQGYARAKKQPGYRPLISIGGVVIRLEVLFRMLNWRELAKAQSFPDDYQFAGTDTEKIKMVGNAVAPALSRALILAAVTQRSSIAPMPIAA